MLPGVYSTLQLACALQLRPCCRHSPLLATTPPPHPPSHLCSSLSRSPAAFEVSYGGTPIFSKLDTGRLPTMAEVVGGIAEAIAAAGGAGAGAAATPQ